MSKRLFVVAMGAVALFGLGSGLAPAKAASPPAPTTINVNAPACVHLYRPNFGFCWYGLH